MAVQTRFKLGLAVWILIFGLIVLNIGILFEYVDWNKRTLGWLLFRIDPRYWPLWPIPLLWGIVTWLANNALKTRFERVASKQLWIRFGIVLIVLCWAVWLAGWTAQTFRRKIYYQLYVAYIMGPISLYLADGTVSWKLWISPTLAVAAIVSLLYVAYRQRRKRHESTIGIETSGEPAE